MDRASNGPRRVSGAFSALALAVSQIALVLATTGHSGAWGGMVVPSTGYVTTLFLESPYPELWFPTYYDQDNVLQARPAAGAHSGVDISNGLVDCVNPVYASANGTVAWTGFDSGSLGWSVVVSHGTGVGANGHATYTVYGHLGRPGITPDPTKSCVVAQVNQSVSAASTLLGYQGSSGNATGTHVHWAILVGPSPLATVTSPYPTGFVPASPDYYTCLALTTGDVASLANQRVSAGQTSCPSSLPPRVFLPVVPSGMPAGW